MSAPRGQTGPDDSKKRRKLCAACGKAEVHGRDWKRGMEMELTNNNIVPRILRDMNDGVLVLDPQGTILFLNEKGRAMLGRADAAEGKKYSLLMMDDDAGSVNDGFHQFVLDAVYDKEHSHSGEVTYQAGDGKKRLHLTSSFLCSEDGKEKTGVVLVMNDITEIALLNQKRRESSVIFAVLMICVCSYLFLWSFLRYININPPGQVMNLVIEGISILMFIVILKLTSFSIHDIGLRIENARATFVPDLLITAAGTALLVLGKVAIQRLAPGFFPEGAPFWDWSAGTFADVVYPFTVVLQEFLARGVMQENLLRIFTGKYAGFLSIFVSALVFGVLHIAYGLPYMLGSFALLGALGVLYHKQGNIWGLCIVHYVLGEVATFLRYF